GASAAVDETVLEQVTEQFDFAEIDLRFFFRLQLIVINFARQSKIPIHSITTVDFSPDPLELFELPWAQSLTVIHMTPGFSDQQILELAKLGRRDLVLTANLSNPATIHRLIEMVHSSRVRRVSITVEIDYYHRFLNSISLREEGDQLLDVLDPSSPVLWFEIDSTYPQYILNTGRGYVYVCASGRNRTIRISTEKVPVPYLESPSHSMSLSRLCPGHDFS
ncbi:hypothetical protein PFISCL1PPCAC_17958, partial [Pristionchus fissidentatus]